MSTRLLRDHLGIPVPRLRFWIGEGLFPLQPGQGKVGHGVSRRWQFRDVVMARLLRDVQDLVQSRNYKLFREIRETLDDPTRQWRVHGGGKESKDEWILISWAGSEHRVSYRKGTPWEELHNSLYRVTGQSRVSIRCTSLARDREGRESMVCRSGGMMCFLFLDVRCQCANILGNP